MKLVILSILVITRDYINKIVVLLGKGTFTSRVDLELPRWLVLSTERVFFCYSRISCRYDSCLKRLENDAFYLYENSSEASFFKKLMRG